MHEGNHMGIMTTLKKTYPRKGGVLGGQSRAVPITVATLQALVLPISDILSTL